MGRLATTDGFQPLTAIAPDELEQLRAHIAELAVALDTLPDLLGLSA